MNEPLLKRGMENPLIVDLITFDPGENEVVIVMEERRPWESVTQKQVQEKFNSYLGYVLEGFLFQQYVQYTGNPVRFELQCIEKPPPSWDPFLTAVISFAKSEKIRFFISLVEPEVFQKRDAETKNSI